MGTKWRTENTSTALQVTDTAALQWCVVTTLQWSQWCSVYTVCHTALTTRHASDTDPSISQLQRSFVCPMMYWPQLLPLPLFSNLIHWCSSWSSTSASSQFSLVPQFLLVKPMMDRHSMQFQHSLIHTERTNHILETKRRQSVFLYDEKYFQNSVKNVLYEN